MHTTVIDFQTALSILVNIVKDFGPEHKAPNGNEGCTYFVRDKRKSGFSEDGLTKFIDLHNLRPVCIVGQAFHRLGIMRALLANGGDQHSACTMDSVIWANAEAMGVTFTEDAKTLFRKAQYRQDNGEAWVDAVRGAVLDSQRDAVKAFEASSDMFGYSVDHMLTEVPAPLAEWEKELLNS